MMVLHNGEILVVGQTWNVDGSIAEACYNADIAQYRTNIIVPRPRNMNIILWSGKYLLQKVRVVYFIE